MLTRHEYWNTEIAFPCPITERKHLVGDCFNNCEMWGRTYQKDDNGRAVVILHCYMDCHGERELHSGKITRDN